MREPDGGGGASTELFHQLVIADRFDPGIARLPAFRRRRYASQGDGERATQADAAAKNRVTFWTGCRRRHWIAFGASRSEPSRTRAAIGKQAASTRGVRSRYRFGRPGWR